MQKNWETLVISYTNWGGGTKSKGAAVLVVPAEALLPVGKMWP